MNCTFDIFLSYLNSDFNGQPTPDRELAKTLSDYFNKKGLKVFFAPESLIEIGCCEYKRTIEEVLVQVPILVAIACSPVNLESNWVRYEWNSYHNSLLTGKSAGSLFSYISGFPKGELPLALQQFDSFEHSEQSLERLHKFIISAKRKIPAINEIQPEPKKKLQTRTITASFKNRIERAVCRRLPEGCTVTPPIAIFEHDGTIEISIELLIERSMMIFTGQILETVELDVLSVANSIGQTPSCQFKFRYYLKKETPETNLNRILSETFKLESKSKEGEAFKKLRLGKLKEAVLSVNKNTFKSPSLAAFSSCILAECYFRLNGPNDALTQQWIQEVSKWEKSGKIDLNVRAFSTSWLLLFYSGRKDRSIDIPQIIMRLRRTAEELLEVKSGLSGYSRAELNFSLGFSWERANDFNLEICRLRYQVAEKYYIQSEAWTESDRLFNTMGHLLTNTTSFSEAQHYLGLAEQIREAKGDKVGLAFTFGCLGDLLARQCRFEEAADYYRRDISVLEEVLLIDSVPHVNLKLAEQMIRKGLVFHNLCKVQEGISLAEKLLEKQADTFFTHKILAKAWLGIAALCEQQTKKNKLIGKACDILGQMEYQSSYEHALFCRLKGRSEGLRGNTEKAQEWLLRSKVLFEAVTDPLLDVGFGIQSLICSIETIRWTVNFQDASYQVMSLKPFMQLKSRIDETPGFSESVYSFLNQLSNDLSSSANNPNNIAERLSQLIWMMES